MATPYGAAVMQPPPGGELRSVTPAMGNTRGARYASAPRMGGAASHNPNEVYATQRSMTPNRYLGAYNRNDDTAIPGAAADEQRSTPSSTGLIRLTLKKPMGIVFEPMYDPNQPSLQRGVRICDLPRTGAAALSRKLQVGDELLQINDRTVSRLSFDEIMDFIIDADPESVNLLFRRPRKETLQARQGVQQKLNAAANKDAPSTVKWVDEDPSNDKPKKEKEVDTRKDSRKKSKRSKKEAQSEEDETIQSSVAGSESYVRGRRTRKGRSRPGPYESESFLDMLIDTICSNSGNVCRDSFRKNDEYYSDEESFNSDHGDESTYVTYDDSVDKRDRKKSQSRHHSMKEDTIYEEDEEDSEAIRRNRRKEKHDPPVPSSSDRKASNSNKYEDDGTLQTDDESNDRVKMDEAPSPPHHAPPLGLAPPPAAPSPPPPAPLDPPVQEFVEDPVNPAPIKEVEYDERHDHGADVSVMESLGGPSLLIEKQRAAQNVQRGSCAPVPSEILDEFGLDYPADFGKSRVETIQESPLKFYTYVVKGLLEEHEPEKVRLLDKLLAKYKGREDHLVQKLSVRYNRPHDDQDEEQDGEHDPEQKDEHDDLAFSDAVKKSKESISAAVAVSTAKERMQKAPMEPPEASNASNEWPEKEQKEPEPEDEEEEERSETGSEYSGDSVDGTSPAVIAQVSELLNYVYGKTSVPGQIDRVSTIMRAYEGREAVLLELLETKALIKANKEKENADNLPAFLRNSAQLASQSNPSMEDDEKLPAVTPMAQAPGGIHDDISSMSGVSSPAVERDVAGHRGVNVSTSQETEEAERPSYKTSTAASSKKDSVEGPQELLSTKSASKPPTTPADRKKKKGIFGGLFGKRKGKEGSAPVADVRSGSRQRTRKTKGPGSVEASI
eukprot:scaffold83_cov181-Amphora_coffeaeformis.AAC.19